MPLWFDAVKRPRYYQELAVNRVTDAIAARQRRILLTLATGTGKTFIAFQIAWKLFKARWNLQAAKGFYAFVLDNYVQEGVDVFTRDDALSQLIVTKYHTGRRRVHARRRALAAHRHEVPHASRREPHSRRP